LPLLLVNGVAIDGVIEIEVQSNSFFAADRFSACLALSATGSELWSGPSLLVEVRISLDGDWASLITGMADTVSIDPIRGEVRLSGRDLTSRFVSAQVEESFENRTSSDIANLLASRRGLAASVETTTALIGRYYQTSRTRTALPQHARATTEWDLLCWLAQLENFDVWVSGQTLNFEPAADQVAPSLSLSPGDCISLNMHHALDIAAGVTVTVKSWDSLSQNAIVQTSSNTADPGTASSRTIIRPNLSSEDAQTLANLLVSQISGHERSLTIEVPGELVTVPRMILALVDTGTDFDGQYVACSVERRLTFAHGFTQTIEARSVPWMPS
jgi:phage protein D